jgi:hypothetical protein
MKRPGYTLDCSAIGEGEGEGDVEGNSHYYSGMS